MRKCACKHKTDMIVRAHAGRLTGELGSSGQKVPTDGVVFRGDRIPRNPLGAQLEIVLITTGGVEIRAPRNEFSRLRAFHASAGRISGGRLAHGQVKPVVIVTERVGSRRLEMPGGSPAGDSERRVEAPRYRRRMMGNPQEVVFVDPRPAVAPSGVSMSCASKCGGRGDAGSVWRRIVVAVVVAGVLLGASEPLPAFAARTAAGALRAGNSDERAVGVLETGCGTRYGSAAPFVAWWSAAPSVVGVRPGVEGQTLGVWQGSGFRSFALWPELGLAVDSLSGEQHRAAGLDRSLLPLGELGPARRPENLPDDSTIAKRHLRLTGAFDHIAYQNHAVALVYGKILGAVPSGESGESGKSRRLLLKITSWIGRVEIRDPYLVVNWPVGAETEIRLPQVGEALIAAVNPAVPVPQPGNAGGSANISEWDLAIPLPVGVVAVVGGKTAPFHTPATPITALPAPEQIRMRWNPPVPVYGQDPQALLKFLKWSLPQDPFRFPRPPIPQPVAAGLRF